MDQQKMPVHKSENLIHQDQAHMLNMVLHLELIMVLDGLEDFLGRIHYHYLVMLII